MQQETVGELVMLIGAVTTGLLRSSEKLSSFKIVRQEQAMGNALRDAMKRYKGDAGVEPVVQALLKKQPHSEAKQAVESPDLTDDEIMARLAALDELLTDDEKSFKLFLMEIAEQIVKASASAGFLGIGKSSNERELAFLNKLKSAMKM